MDDLFVIVAYIYLIGGYMLGHIDMITLYDSLHELISLCNQYRFFDGQERRGIKSVTRYYHVLGGGGDSIF